MRILVNAAIALRVRTMVLSFCGCTPACVPELTRLVTAGALRLLFVSNDDVELFEAGPDTDQFCAAVRASPLMRLHLDDLGPNPDAAAVVESSMRDMWMNWVPNPDAAAVAAFLTASRE